MLGDGWGQDPRMQCKCLGNGYSGCGGCSGYYVISLWAREAGRLSTGASELRRLRGERAGAEHLGSDSLCRDRTPGPRLGGLGQARCSQVLCLRSPTPGPGSRRGQPKPNSFRTQDRIFISKSLFFLLFSLLFLSSHLYPSGCKPRKAPKYKSQIELKAYGLCAPSPPPSPLNYVLKQHGDF